MASSVHHFKAAEDVLAKIAARQTDVAHPPPSPETYHLWLESAKVHVALAGVALAVELALETDAMQVGTYAWTKALT